MAQKFSNTARSALSTALGSGGTSLTLTGLGSLFPVADVNTGTLDTGDWFKAVLQDSAGIEIIYVRTHTSGADTFSNVMRGREGTTARSFAAGSVVGLRVTADDMEAQANRATDAQLLDRTNHTGTQAISTVDGLQAALDAKQAALSSGANIKTINGETLLGSGDLAISGQLAVESVSSNTAAVAGRLYVMTASLTLTLPSSPSIGDRVGFVNASGTSTCVVARNGARIMGLAENMTIDLDFSAETLVYTGASKGWWVE